VAVVAVAAVITTTVACSSSGGKSSTAGTSDPGNGGTWTIGLINTETGASGVVGQAEQLGVDFAISQVNAAGGINGHKLAVKLYDDQGQPAQATIAVQRLATSDKVPLILGPGLTASALAIAPKVEQYKIPNINFVSNTDVVKDNDYAYEFVAPQSFNGEAMVKYLTSKNIKSAYLLSSSTPYGEAGAEGVKAAATTSGVTISGSETYDATATDFTPQASKIASAKPAAVLAYGSGSSVDGQMLKALRTSGYTGLVVGDLGFALSNIPSVAGAATKNLVALSPLNYAATSGPAYEFIQAYKSAKGSLPSVTTSYGYEAVMVAAKAIAAAKSFTASDIQSALESLQYTGVLGDHDYTSQHLGPQTASAFTPIQFSGSDYVPAS
jgi:branched-chain amino acid transport system substrate-binding protein